MSKPDSTPRSQPPSGKKAGLKRPSFLAKLPPLYLYSGLATLGMVGYILFVGLTAPGPDQQVAPVAEAPVPIPAAVAPPGPDDHLPVMGRAKSVIPVLSRTVQMPQAEFLSRTVDVQGGILVGNGRLAYRFRVPKDWTAQTLTADDVALTPSLPTTLVEYVSPASIVGRGRIRVQAQILPFQAQAADWALRESMIRLLTLDGMAILSPHRVEASFVTLEGQESYQVRTAVVVTGARVITVEYAIPQEMFELERDLQAWVINSFYIDPDPSQAPEKTKVHDVLNVVRIPYLASWRAQAIDGMGTGVYGVALTSRDLSTLHLPETPKTEVLQGRIDVIILPPGQDDAARLSGVGTALAAQGLVLGPVIGRFDVPAVAPDWTPRRARVFNVSRQNQVTQDFQYWLLEMEGQGRDAMVGLLTPLLSGTSDNWIRNFGAFDFVAGNLATY